MPIIDFTVFLLGGAFGGALVWHFKTFFQTFWRSAEPALAVLNAEAAALQAKIASLKAK